jgi:hypothetical protein
MTLGMCLIRCILFSLFSSRMASIRGWEATKVKGEIEYLV